jgi:hypothetical protein
LSRGNTVETLTRWRRPLGGGRIGSAIVEIVQAQRDVRVVYRGGFPGQLVSGAVWLVAAVVATWGSTTAGMVALLLGGTLIFPLTTLGLRLAGGPVSLPSGHPMAALATQIAFTVPFGLLVALAAAGYRLDWFFPACMVIVGAHYLPFVFLYGMPLFGALGGLLVFGGVALTQWVPEPFPAGGWLTGLALVVFAFLLRASARVPAGTPSA